MIILLYFVCYLLCVALTYANLQREFKAASERDRIPDSLFSLVWSIGGPMTLFVIGIMFLIGDFKYKGFKVPFTKD